MHRRLLPTILGGLLLTGVAPLLDVAPAAATTTQHVVTTTGDVVDANDGLLSLREAVTLAGTDAGESEIVLAAGATYALDLCGTPHEHLNASGDLDLPSSAQGVTVTGNGATIDQTCANERVILTQQPIVVRHLTISGGDVTANDHTENAGAGIFAYDDVTIEDSTFTDLHAVHGASVYGGGDVTATRTRIEDNTATSTAAGLTSVGAATTVSLIDSTITGNTGGVSVALASSAYVAVRNSTISGNTATSNNTYDSIVFSNLGTTLEHTTMTDNTLPNGAALYSGTSVAITNSVLDNGSSPECHDLTPTTTSGGGNVIDDASCGSPQATDQTGVADPGLGALGDNGGATATQLPLASSPVVDAVPAADCDLTTDQRGLVRPQGTGCDAGAVEIQLHPDAALRLGTGPFVGDGVHNTTTIGQHRTAVVGRGGTARFTLRADNDGEAADTLVLRGFHGRGRVTAVYRVAGDDVTSLMAAGRPVPLAVGGQTSVIVRIHVAADAPHGLIRHFVLRARSAGGIEDRVKATVRVR